MNWLDLRFAVLALAVCGATPAAAAVYRVGGGAGCTHATIQGAVNTAVVNGGGDTIQISQNATYTNQAVIIENPNGAVNLAGGFPTCSDNAPTPGAKTLVNGAGGAADAVFSIRGYGIVSFTALDIQQGDQDNSNGGGGIEVRDGPHTSIRLVDTWVRGNQAGRGGGISLDNTFSDNPADTFLELVGDSRVNSNTTTSGAGGGIYCRFATVRVYDASHIWLNSASGSGGGIHADNCPVLLASRGLGGAVLSSNTATGSGGGIALTGALSVADIITVDATVPARIVNNVAGTDGGGIAVGTDARAQIYDGVLADNTANGSGAAVSVYDNNGIATVARFLMQGSTAGAPAGAVNCAQPEACNRITENLAQSIGGPPSTLAIVRLYAGSPLTAFATFRGTRFNDNTGVSLVNFDDNYGQISLDGVLIDGNTVTGPLLRAAGSTNSLVLAASTIADNSIGNNQAVMRGRGFCNINNNYDGSHIYRSIIWQPGSPVFTATSGNPGADCFQYVLAHDLGTLPASALNQSGNPQFRDASSNDYRPGYESPALDYAPGQAANSTRDHGPRVVDLISVANEFGPHDLGAYEIAVDDRIFYNGFQLVLGPIAPAHTD